MEQHFVVSDAKKNILALIEVLMGMLLKAKSLVGL